MMGTLNPVINEYMPIESVAERIFSSGKITREDNQALLRAALEQSLLTSDEMTQVRGLYERLQMGLLKVVD